MGEEFYSTIKLISGEEIFSLVSIDENDGDPVVVLQNPVIIKTMHHNSGTVIKIKPWMELSNDDFFIVKSDKIITMTEVKNPSIINIYKNYLENDDGIEVLHQNTDEKNKVNLTNKMGYISSVESARKNLEKIFKLF